MTTLAPIPQIHSLSSEPQASSSATAASTTDKNALKQGVTPALRLGPGGIPTLAVEYDIVNPQNGEQATVAVAAQLPNLAPAVHARLGGFQVGVVGWQGRPSVGLGSVSYTPGTGVGVGWWQVVSGTPRLGGSHLLLPLAGLSVAQAFSAAEWQDGKYREGDRALAEFLSVVTPTLLPINPVQELLAFGEYSMTSAQAGHAPVTVGEWHALLKRVAANRKHGVVYPTLTLLEDMLVGTAHPYVRSGMMQLRDQMWIEMNRSVVPLTVSVRNAGGIQRPRDAVRAQIDEAILRARKFTTQYAEWLETGFGAAPSANEQADYLTQLSYLNSERSESALPQHAELLQEVQGGLRAMARPGSGLHQTLRADLIQTLEQLLDPTAGTGSTPQLLRLRGGVEFQMALLNDLGVLPAILHDPTLSALIDRYQLAQAFYAGLERLSQFADTPRMGDIAPLPIDHGLDFGSAADAAVPLWEGALVLFQWYRFAKRRLPAYAKVDPTIRPLINALYRRGREVFVAAAKQRGLEGFDEMADAAQQLRSRKEWTIRHAHALAAQTRAALEVLHELEKTSGTMPVQDAQMSPAMLTQMRAWWEARLADSSVLVEKSKALSLEWGASLQEAEAGDYAEQREFQRLLVNLNSSTEAQAAWTAALLRLEAAYQSLARYRAGHSAYIHLGRAWALPITAPQHLEIGL